MKKTRKTNKIRKLLTLVCCAALLMALTVGATYAYLTSTDSVKNTFTVGNVQITLDEAKVNTDGEWTDGHETRVDENAYHLLPGQAYKKDPTVTVKADSEDCYVRCIVTLTKGDAIHALPAEFEIEKCFDVKQEIWNVKGETYDPTGEGTYTYEFWYNEKVAASKNDQVLEDLFTTITIPDDITNEQLASLNGMEINVVAHAIQAEGFADATAAWGAWE